MNELIVKRSSLESPQAGRIQAWLARYGNVDDQGDVFLPGAFSDWLAANGDKPIPILKGHNISEFPLGVWNSFEETPEGLKATGELALDDNPDAQVAANMIKKGIVFGVSVGFKIKEATPTRRLEGKYGRDIKAAWLEEASITPFKPSNSQTTITSLDEEPADTIFKGAGSADEQGRREAEYWAAELVKAVAKRDGLI